MFQFLGNFNWFFFRQAYPDSAAGDEDRAADRDAGLLKEEIKLNDQKIRTYT